jgi:hypothetical protein
MGAKERVLVRPRPNVLQQLADSTRVSMGEKHGRGKPPIA